MKTIFSLILALLISNISWAQAQEGQHYKKIDTPPELRVELELGVDVEVQEYRHLFIYQGLNDDGRAVIDIDFSGKYEYAAQPHDPGDTGFRTNPFNYSDLNSSNLRDYAKRVYRMHYSCAGEKNFNIHYDGDETIELAGGYANHTGTSRFYEQCILDGSFDGFYDEVYAYGDVDFIIGQSKSAYDFELVVLEADEYSALIKITYTGRGRFVPTGKDYENQAVSYLERVKN